MSAPREHSSSTTSSSLLQRARAGDQDAWTKLVDLYTPLVYARCRHGGLSPSDSSDVMQDVFRNVFRKLGDFERDDQGQSFRRWLRTIVRNAIIDCQRKASKAPDAVGGSQANLQFHQTSAPDVDESSGEHLDSAMKVLLRKNLDLLREEHEEKTWTAFWMTVVEDKAPKDVAETLGMRPASVRQAKYRILRRLRERLGDAE